MRLKGQFVGQTGRLVRREGQEGWKHATLKLWQGVCKSLPPGGADTLTKGADLPPAPDGAAHADIRIFPIQI